MGQERWGMRAVLEVVVQEATSKDGAPEKKLTGSEEIAIEKCRKIEWRAQCVHMNLMCLILSVEQTGEDEDEAIETGLSRTWWEVWTLNRMRGFERCNDRTWFVFYEECFFCWTGGVTVVGGHVMGRAQSYCSHLLRRGDSGLAEGFGGGDGEKRMDLR